MVPGAVPGGKRRNRGKTVPTKLEIARNWLPRYTGMPLDGFGNYILLTNFSNYVMLQRLPIIEVLISIKCLTARKIIIMAKIRVTQVRSRIGRPVRQKRTLDALGLRKMNQTVEHELTPQIMGMVNEINHLVKFEEI